MRNVLGYHKTITFPSTNQIGQLFQVLETKKTGLKFSL